MWLLFWSAGFAVYKFVTSTSQCENMRNLTSSTSSYVPKWSTNELQLKCNIEGDYKREERIFERLNLKDHKSVNAVNGPFQYLVFSKSTRAESLLQRKFKDVSAYS